MPKEYSIEVVDEIAVVHFKKKANALDVLSAIDDVAAIGKCNRRLWIFDSGFESSTRIDDVRKVANYGKKIWPVPSKVAFVASDDHAFGLSRMHEVFGEREGVESNVFRTPQEAIIWLKGNDT